MIGSPVLRGGVLVAAYLTGAVPCGLLLGKILHGTDVRSTGSGNIGATNVARSLGLGAGVITLVLDVFKGSLATWAGGRMLGDPVGASLAGLAALLGHIFPVYLGFRGGKGVATGLGVFLMLDAQAALGAFGVFVIVILATRRVSPGSMLASLSLPLILHYRGASPIFLATGWASSLLIVVSHRDNLRRLLAGTEPRLGERKS